jgi:tetratricopeptide (TPR) repeat protein
MKLQSILYTGIFVLLAFGWSTEVSCQIENEALFEEARELALADSLHEAILLWEEVLKSDPGNYRALNNIARATLNLYSAGEEGKETVKLAVSSFGNAFPDSAETHCRKGRLEFLLGNYRKSAREYEKSPHDHARADRLLSLSRAWLSNKRRCRREMIGLCWQENATALSYITIDDMSFALDAFSVGRGETSLEEISFVSFQHSLAYWLPYDFEEALEVIEELDDLIEACEGQLSDEVKLYMHAAQIWQFAEALEFPMGFVSVVKLNEELITRLGALNQEFGEMTEDDFSSFSRERVEEYIDYINVVWGEWGSR